MKHSRIPYSSPTRRSICLVMNMEALGGETRGLGKGAGGGGVETRCNPALSLSLTHARSSPESHINILSNFPVCIHSGTYVPTHSLTHTHTTTHKQRYVPLSCQTMKNRTTGPGGVLVDCEHHVACATRLQSHGRDRRPYHTRRQHICAGISRASPV